MLPFPTSEGSKHLLRQYPNSDDLAQAVTAMEHSERDGLLRLWITEGIPFAFRDNPMLYETVRGWLGIQLKVHPKAVTLVGSGRIGFSMKPFPAYGRPFQNQSDLDFSVIDERLYTELVDTYFSWERDFENGTTAPRSDRERSFWAENIVRIAANINRGFIDPHLIPTFLSYPAVVRVQDAMAALKAKLDVTASAPPVKKASVRVFRDWVAACNQLTLNLALLAQSIRLRQSPSEPSNVRVASSQLRTDPEQAASSWGLP